MTAFRKFPLPSEPGLWLQRENTREFSGRPALFLDRDGVIVEEINYLHRIEDCRFIDGATKTVRRANELGLATIIVTNQSGVGRGYYDWDQFAALQAFILAQFRQAGAEIDMVIACAYHTKGQPPFDKTGHEWRKPNPGMILAAKDTLDLDLANSWLIGDSSSDVEAARQANLAGAFHVLTGHGARDRATLNAATSDFDVRKIAAIGDAYEDLARLFDKQ